MIRKSSILAFVCVLCIVYLCPAKLSAQTLFREFSFKHTAGAGLVMPNGDTSYSAFTGGFHRPQFNNIDVNLDGIIDLLVFDQEDDQIMVFLGNGNKNNPSFQHAPQFEILFPKAFAWLRIVDFNGDKKPDIFTSNTIGGVMVYKNVSTSTDLKFELYNDDLKHFDTDLNFKTALFVAPSDIPVVDDVDGDGDIDILSFDGIGSNVTFYNNQSIDVYDHRDSFNYIVTTYCWGRFQEGESNDTIIFAPRCFLYKKAKHAGSNMLLIDIDDDGDKDLLLSDVSSQHVNLLENGWNPRSGSGHSRDTMIKATSRFPRYTKSVDVDLFPSMHYCDVDFDGVNDLICAPSSHEKNFVVYNTWLYKNNGENNKPEFEYIQDDFLQNKTIETGERSFPALMDYDGDGDLDLFVASPKPYVNYEYDSAYFRLFYYENVGDSSKPAFKLVDEDFLNLSARRFDEFAPAFGDVDNNGTIDLLLGLSNGRMAFMSNSNKPRKMANFTWETKNYASLKVSGYAKPCVFDINNDGKNDIIVGDLVGKLAYFEWDNANNTHILVDNFWLEINVGSPSIGFSAPQVADFDNDGNLELVVGESPGKLNYFKNFVYNQKGYETENTIIYSDVTDKKYARDFGDNSTFSAGDLNADGLVDLIFGGKRGGLGYLLGYEYIYDGLIDAPNSKRMTLFPNPANNNLKVSWEEHDKIGQIEIVDLSGKVVRTTNIINGATLDVSDLNAGVFAVLLRLPNGQVYAGKIVKHT